MNNRGVTLVELMVAVAIIAILIAALAFNYQGWQGRYKVEGAIKTLYADLMNARAQAMQQATTFLVDFPVPAPPCKRSYRVANDTNGDGTIQESEVLAAFQCPPGSSNPSMGFLEYAINGGVLLTFDSKGLVYSGTPPVLIANPRTISLVSTASPDYDCIRIGSTRINMGQMQGGVCNVK